MILTPQGHATHPQMTSPITQQPRGHFAWSQKIVCRCVAAVMAGKLQIARSMVLERGTYPGTLCRSRLVSTSSNSSDPPQDRRLNPLGIQMLCKPLYKRMFPQSSGGKGKKEPAPNPTVVQQSVQHLKSQGLWGKECSTMADLDMQLPQMLGGNLDEHFRAIAKTQSQVYLDLAKQLAQAKLRPMPSKWSSETGWTRYDPITGHGESVEYPADDAVVLDVETCVTEGQRPILAVAVSPNAWYSWTSPRMASSQDFIDHMERSTNLEDLIPMESSSKGGVNELIEGVKSGGSWEHPRLIVGHHVSYDRARLKEQYFIRVRRCSWSHQLYLSCLNCAGPSGPWQMPSPLG